MNDSNGNSNKQACDISNNNNDMVIIIMKVIVIMIMMIQVITGQSTLSLVGAITRFDFLFYLNIFNKRNLSYKKIGIVSIT